MNLRWQKHAMTVRSRRGALLSGRGRRACPAASVSLDANRASAFIGDAGSPWRTRIERAERHCSYAPVNPRSARARDRALLCL